MLQTHTTCTYIRIPVHVYTCQYIHVVSTEIPANGWGNVQVLHVSECGSIIQSENRVLEK